MFEHVAVIGVGLLGGSICRCVRRVMPGTVITGIERDAAELSAALADGSIDYASTLAAADLSAADLIVIATPVATSLYILQNILDRTDLRDDVLIIDVGSVKEAPVSLASGHPRGGRFVGCHPMAGSEKTGYENATTDLYSGAAVIVTPSPVNITPDVEKAERFWEAMGARVSLADPAVHDFMVAYTSHLPHVAACAVVDAFTACLVQGAVKGEETAPYIGRGFRDVTRISSGSPGMWEEIITLNKSNIARSLGDLIRALTLFLDLLEKGKPGDVRGYFERIKSVRDGVK